MENDWRRLTRAAYVVAGHLDAAVAQSDPGDDPAAAGTRRAAGDPTAAGTQGADGMRGADVMRGVDGTQDPDGREGAGGRAVRHRAGSLRARGPRVTLAPRAARALAAVLATLAAAVALHSCGASEATPVPAGPSAGDVAGTAGGTGADGTAADGTADLRGAGEASGGSNGDPKSSGQPDAPTTDAPATDAAAPRPVVVVHVVGAVRTPGLVEVPTGARIGDAVAAAGGALEGARVDTINLARPAVDGEQVRVPAAGEEPVPTAAPPAGASTPGVSVPGGEGGVEGAPAGGSPLDLNTATGAQLEELPGIGPALATRILEHRDSIGGFTDVAELDDVSGIGPAVLGGLDGFVTAGP